MITQAIKTAMLGGSFNPIHYGHIQLAKAVKKELDIDRILMVPTYSTPLKDNSEMILPQHRLNMCKIMCREYLDIFVSEIEIQREGRSYTVDTLKRLKSRHPTDELYLIVGADMFLTLDKWKDPKKIFSYASICTVPRNETDYRMLLNKSADLTQLGAKCHILKEPVASISSTQIRNSVRQGSDVSSLVGEEVAKYITENNLYKE